MMVYGTQLSICLGFQVEYISHSELTVLRILSPIIIFSINRDKQKSLLPLILFMQAALNGVFMAKDGLMFYIFWELALIPIYFICLLYSSKDAFKTTIKFFIYTFIGSL